MGAVHVGATAPLNEQGYVAVASVGSDYDMSIFVERILAKEGKQVVDRGCLAGFVPYYSGTKSVQSYHALCKELKTVTWVSLARPHHEHICDHQRWKPNAMCDGIQAKERVDWLECHMGMTRDQAKGKVMAEFPQVFSTHGGMNQAHNNAHGLQNWKPNAMCDGIPAKERVEWLMTHMSMTREQARCKVIAEYPGVFSTNNGGNSNHQQQHCSGAGVSGPTAPACWKPNAMCDGIPAKERVGWLMSNMGMTREQARCKILGEYPGVFGQHWKPNAICDGKTGKERVDWLVSNTGISREEARGKVMVEFPGVFSSTSGNAGPAGGAAGRWNPMADCDGLSAQDRCTWLQNTEGMNMQAARAKVMREFPVAFRWNPNADCSGSRAEDRADWLIRNEGMNRHQAQEKVMLEFPAQFP